MSGHREVTYSLDAYAARQILQKNNTFSSARQPPDDEATGLSIPRIARLMALAIRFEGLLEEKTIQDYTELAHLGRVTRARMTQIMQTAPPGTGYSGTNSLSAAPPGPQ